MVYLISTDFPLKPAFIVSGIKRRKNKIRPT